MSVGQPARTSTIVKEWLEQPAPAPPEPEEESDSGDDGDRKLLAYYAVQEHHQLLSSVN